jgi:two-component sensor histidine kinase
MALIHEKLYQSQDFANIDFSDYIENLARSLFHSYAADDEQVTLKTDVDVSLDIDRAIPCGLIVNELLSNSLKHAFPENRKGTIDLSFHMSGTDYVLRFKDDGIGLPSGLDFRNTESLGLQLVVTLTNQLGGLVDLGSSKGTEFDIRFPVNHLGKAGGNLL